MAECCVTTLAAIWSQARYDRVICSRHCQQVGQFLQGNALLIPKVILIESFISFLGLGVQEPYTSWGGLITDGARNIQGAAYLLIVPGLFLTATLFALNFIGDGLRDALDPKDR